MGCLTANEIGLLFLAVAAVITFFHWLTTREYEILRGDQFRVTPDGFTRSREGFAYVKGAGGRAYKVHEDLQNPELAATTMDQLSELAQRLINALYAKYIDSSTGLNLIKPQFRSVVRNGIISLKRNFKSSNIEENIPARSGGDTSYVIDKGEVFAMCLRDPKNNNQLEGKLNNLTFVLVHELAHIFTTTYGHDTLYWNNFKFLLQEAVELGIYEAVNYKKTGSPYCGIVVTYSPLFDSTLKEYRA